MREGGGGERDGGREREEGRVDWRESVYKSKPLILPAASPMFFAIPVLKFRIIPRILIAHACLAIAASNIYYHHCYR